MDVEERRSLVQQQSIYISMLQQAIKRADADKDFASALPVLLPTLATGAVLVMTPTVSPGDDDMVLRLLDARFEDGTPVVRKSNWVPACKDCERKDIADRCTHIVRLPQHSQSVNQ